MTEQDVIWIMNSLLNEAGEPARVSKIEPYKAWCIDVDGNGKRSARHLPGYHGLTVTLDQDLRNPTKVYHHLDQNINAEIRIRRGRIYLDTPRMDLPYTAPTPRYR